VNKQQVKAWKTKKKKYMKKEAYRERESDEQNIMEK